MYPCNSPFASEITNVSGSCAFSSDRVLHEHFPRPGDERPCAELDDLDFGGHATVSSGFQPAIGCGAGQGDGLLGAEPVYLGPAHLLCGCANPSQFRQSGRGNHQGGLGLRLGRQRAPRQLYKALPDPERQIGPANDGWDDACDGLPQQPTQPLDLRDAAVAQHMARALIAGRPGVIEDRTTGGQHGALQGSSRGAGEVGADYG